MITNDSQRLQFKNQEERLGDVFVGNLLMLELVFALKISNILNNLKI